MSNFKARSIEPIRRVTPMEENMPYMTHLLTKALGTDLCEALPAMLVQPTTA